MGVCVSSTDSKAKRNNRNGNSNTNQMLQKQNDKTSQNTIPTDNMKQDNQNNQLEICNNDQNKNKAKETEKERNISRKDNEPSLNQLITMSFDKPVNHSQTKIKEEEDKLSNRIQITNKSDQLQVAKYEDCLYSFIEINLCTCSSYSTESDWSHPLKSAKKNSTVHLANRLLSLNERRWNKENMQLNNIIKLNRDHLDSYIMNKYLNHRMKLNEHFNWFIWALSIYYRQTLLNSAKHDFNSKDLGLPDSESTEWLIGFEWKGVYIKVIDESHSLTIKKEIKALNYLFFEYVQILDCVSISNDSETNLLSDEIVFPLISYSKFNGVYLMGSVCIPKIQINTNVLNDVNLNVNLNSQSQRKETILKTAQFREIIINNNTINENDIFIKNKDKQRNRDRDRESISNIANDNDSIHLINDTQIYNRNIDLSQFSLDDLSHSHLFNNIKESNLIKLIDTSDIQSNTSMKIQHKEKYMIINAIELIPSLYHSYNKSEVILVEDGKPISYPQLPNRKNAIDEVIKTNLQYGECKYVSDAYGLFYKVYSNTNDKGKSSNSHRYNSNTNINPAANMFFIRNHINQLGRELYEKVSTPSINKFEWLKKALIASKKIKVLNKTLIQYSLMKDIKIKYSLITQHDQTIKLNSTLYDDQYHKRIKFTNIIEQFAKVINNVKGIADYDYLSNLFNRFGINKIFQLFVLAKISNHTIADLIKIDILTSIISHYINFEEGIGLVTKISVINYEFGTKEDIITNSRYESIVKEKSIGNIRLCKIHLILLTILNTSKVNKNDVKKVMEQLSYALYIQSLKWRVIDKEFNFNIFNSKHYDDPLSVYNNFSHSKMLNELISIARNKPFLFISSIEKKLSFSIAPDIKLASSISIEHFITVFNKDSINLNDPLIKTYINPLEITYYLLAKSIDTTNKGLRYETEKEQIQFNSKQVFPNHNQPSTNQSKLSHDRIESSSLNNEPQQQQPNVTIDKISRNYVYKLKPNNITKINNMNNKFIPSNNLDMQLESKSNITDIRHNTKRDLYANNNNMNTQYNRTKYWELISSGFQFNFPPLIYKMTFVYNEIFNDKKTIYKYLSNAYKIKQIETIKDWRNSAEIVLNEVYTVNNGENTICHVYLYLFLHYVLVIDDMKNAKEIIMKMKDKMLSALSYGMNWFIVMNYLKGLLKEKVSFIESEEFYSKTVIFALYLFGDPRGRHSNGHFISLFPIWKIARQSCILDNALLTNEALKELFYCQDYWFKALISPAKMSKVNNWFISSLKYVSLIPQIESKFKLVSKEEIDKENNNNSNSNSIDDKSCDDDLIERPSLVPTLGELDKRFVLSERNFDMNAFNIPDCPFPSISNKQSSLNNVFNTERFFAFLLKGFSSIVFEGDYHPFSEEYLIKTGLNFDTSNCHLTTSESSSCKINSQTNGSAYHNNNKSTKLKGNRNILSSYLYDILLKRLDFKLHPPSGTVISWGNNSHNETSHNNYDCLFFPRTVYKLKEQEITKLSAGWEYSIVLSKKNLCFGWGNNQYGQCGVGEGQNVSNPTLVKGLSNVKDISCGNEHSLAITNDGALYSWGNPEDGVLGYKSKTTQYTPIKVTGMNGTEQISCGTIHNLALTDKGQVYSWGCTKGGQLGLSEQYLLSIKDFNGYIYEPTLIDAIKHETIVSISSGEAHSLALTSKGKIYTWGFGSNGQLGLGFCEDSFEPGLGLAKSRRLLPIQLPFDERVSHIQCGKTFSMIISEKKELYAFGVNDLNQLGLDDEPPMTHLHNQMDIYNSKCSDFVSPTRLEIFLHMHVLRIACGESHCLAIVKDLSNGVKTLWSWGSNRFGQLGKGIQDKKSTPKPVNYFLNYRNSEIADIACGGFHSLCLLRGPEVNFFDGDTVALEKLIEIIIKIWK